MHLKDRVIVRHQKQPWFKFRSGFSQTVKLLFFFLLDTKAGAGRGFSTVQGGFIQKIERGLKGWSSRLNWAAREQSGAR